MCGICGIVSDLPDKATIVSRMMVKMKHRGPDDEGMFDSKFCSLGNTRLAIIDVNKGKLPVYNETGNLVLVFNGEIYNYLELKHNLIQLGHIFKTESDSEVLLHLFEEHGVDCLKYLNGMFAFSIWNKKSKELFFARDRLGIKPFYYNLSKDYFVFASELKTLLASGLVKKEVSPYIVFIYLMSNGIAAPQTIIKHIKALQPGYYGIFKEKKLQIKKYWSLKKNLYKGSYNNALNELKFLLEKSINQRLQSDVPMGLFLSGGIDSSTIAAYALKKNKMKTFSVGFEKEYQDWNEVKSARSLAKILDSDHHEVCITKTEFSEDFDIIINNTDQPSRDVFNSWFVSKHASEHVKVALSGTGGDEIFFGYPHIGRIYKEIKNSQKPVFEVYAKKMKYFNPFEANNLILDKLFNNYKGVYNKYWQRIIAYESQYAEGDKLIRLVQEHWLNSVFLRDIDVMSMAHSLEVRVPFLDHKLVEFTYNLPLEWLHCQNEGYKLILKDLMKKELPTSVINGKKKGFTLPFNGFLNDKRVEEKIRYYLSKNNVERTGVLYYKMVDLLVNDFYSGKRFNYNQLMSVVVLQAWLMKNI